MTEKVHGFKERVDGIIKDPKTPARIMRHQRNIFLGIAGFSATYPILSQFPKILFGGNIQFTNVEAGLALGGAAAVGATAINLAINRALTGRDRNSGGDTVVRQKLR